MSVQQRNYDSMTETQSTKHMYRFVLNGHHKRPIVDQSILKEISLTDPSKSVACTRCRRLRKKCSKHYPCCLTCAKMCEKCEYVDKSSKPKKKRELSNQHEEDSPDSQSQDSQQNTAQIFTAPPPQQPKLTLPPLDSHPNYIYGPPESSILPTTSTQTTSASSSTPAVTSTTHPNSIRLPSISLKSAPFNANRPTISITSKQPRPQSRSQSQVHLQTNDIQSAILSTLINLGKENLKPAATFPPNLLSKSTALKYAHAYFDAFYNSYPFIHKNRFFKDFETVDLNDVLNVTAAARPVLLKSKVNFQLFLILTIGYKLLKNENRLTSEELEIGDEIFMNENISEKIQSSTTFSTAEDVKILILLVIDLFFTKNCSSTCNLTNLLTGLTMRCNLNRRLGRSSSDELTRYQIEMRYRLFWSVYILDRTVATYLNRLATIPDDYINIPFPIHLDGVDDADDNLHNIFRLIIDLKKIEGEISQNVHSVIAINNKPYEEKSKVLRKLRNKIENWYLQCTNFTKLSNTSPLWFTTMYYNSLTLLYRHSYLVPTLPEEQTIKLSKAVLQNLSYSYNSIMNQDLASASWFSFYRILVIYKTLFQCLTSKTIYLQESKTEINLCIEILDHYNKNPQWSFISELIDVFKNLLNLCFQENYSYNELYEILKQEELKFGNILKVNSVGCRFNARVEDDHSLEARIDDEYNL